MAKIIVNDNLQVNGKLNVERSLVEENYSDKDGNIKTRKYLKIEGILSTHLYFEDITKIETNRYEFLDVEVYKEAFASDDYNILYYFTAKDMNIKGASKNGIVYILYGEEMRMIEDEMYKDEHPILGDIGIQYKDMYKNEEETEEEEE